MPNAEMTRAMVHYTAEAEARMARTEAETARLSARLEETREGHAACAGELEATRATLGRLARLFDVTSRSVFVRAHPAIGACTYFR